MTTMSPSSATVQPLKVLSIFGTRPEAIKMAPLVKALQAQPQQFEATLCVTAQHRGMLDQVLALFELQPDVDLDVMKPNQDLFYLTTTLLQQLQGVLAQVQPHVVLVHGDTTTTFVASLAAYYSRIPIAHVEAGLRTFNTQFPFPEEMNRVLTDAVATLMFAPTQQAYDNLLQLRGNNPQGLFITGNTVIDALHHTLAKTAHLPPFLPLEPHQRLALVTVHRRENFGEPLQGILRALQRLLAAHEDLVMALPVHPNPNVKPLVEAALGGHPRVRLLEPLDYEPFCRLMKQAHLVLTDSGGVQEEAPSLGVPVLVLRDETERPEAVAAGTVALVGPHEERIVAMASRLLNEPAAYAAMQQAVNPYGDGHAIERIVEHLKAFNHQRVQGGANPC
jgi:UDP-N-acetylglucosamine 2-epimerase (non-hydrolysing)